MSQTTIDTERREVYAERRAARMSRGQERRAARQRKRSERVLPGFESLGGTWPTVASDGPLTEELARPTGLRHQQAAAAAAIAQPAEGQRQSVSEAEPPQGSVDQSTVVGTTTGAGAATASTETVAANSSRAQRIAAFLARREDGLRAARREARMRIAREGAERALADAFGALAHPQARPWQRDREQLDQALASTDIQQVRRQALAGARRAAADAARTSKRAPDPDLASAVSVAFMVIACAPAVATGGRGAQRSRPRPNTGTRAQRPFWR